MMAVSERGLICLALGDGRGSEGGEVRDLKTRRGEKNTAEAQVWKYLFTESLTEDEAERSTVVGIASEPELSIL